MIQKFNIKQFKGHFCDLVFRIPLISQPGDRFTFQSILTKYGIHNKL